MNRYEGIDEFITTVIEKETEKLQGRFGIGADDLEDIHQDLHSQVWRKLAGTFAPGHPQYKAAVRRTVDGKIKDLIKSRTAKKRRGDIGRLSLDAPPPEDEESAIPLGDTQDLEALLEAYGDYEPVWHRRRHDKIDVQAALARLPEDLRRLADTIDVLKGNYSAAEEELGLTRKKFRGELDRLRALMKEFLEM